MKLVLNSIEFMSETKILYYEDVEIRRKIDEWLRENAAIEASLGKDSTKKEFADAKVRQHDLYLKIKIIDIEFYNRIVIKN